MNKSINNTPKEVELKGVVNNDLIEYSDFKEFNKIPKNNIKEGSVTATEIFDVKLEFQEKKLNYLVGISPFNQDIINESKSDVSNQNIVLFKEKDLFNINNNQKKSIGCARVNRYLGQSIEISNHNYK